MWAVPGKRNFDKSALPHRRGDLANELRDRARPRCRRRGTEPVNNARTAGAGRPSGIRRARDELDPRAGMNRLFERGLTDPGCQGTYIASSPNPVSQIDSMRTCAARLACRSGSPHFRGWFAWLVRTADANGSGPGALRAVRRLQAIAGRAVRVPVSCAESWTRGSSAFWRASVGDGEHGMRYQR